MKCRRHVQSNSAYKGCLVINTCYLRYLAAYLAVAALLYNVAQTLADECSHL